MRFRHWLALPFCGLLGAVAATTSLVQPARSFTAEPIADINPSGSSWPSEFTVFGDDLVFRADDDTGHEPWVWNGSDPPATLEINPLGDSDPAGFTVFGTHLVFRAHDGMGSGTGAGDGAEASKATSLCGPRLAESKQSSSSLNGPDLEPWVWDKGNLPRQIADLHPSGSSNPHAFIVFGAALVFSAYDGEDYHLWSWNGNDPPTEIEPEPMGWYCSRLTEAIVHDGELVFRAHDGTGDEPWAWNGSDPPRKIAEINPAGSSNPHEFTGFGDEIVFSAFDGTHDGLWAWNGTGLPRKIADIDTTASSNPHGFTVFGDQLVFRANESASSAELWAWNGMDLPRKIANINPPKGSNPSPLAVLGGELVFSGRDIAGAEPWAWNGDDPPRAIADINPTGDSDPCEFTVFANNVIFDSFDGTDWALWAWNGKEPPRRIVEDDLNWAFRNEFTVYGDMLAFRADDGVSGWEPWILRASAEDLLDALRDLRDQVMAMDLKKGLTTSLVAKLNSVERALVRDNTEVGANLLQAFTSAVLAQRAKQLTDAQADALIAGAQAIIALLAG